MEAAGRLLKALAGKEGKMKRNIVTRTITGSAVGLAMMVGITIATAQAQYRDYEYRGRSNQQDDYRDRDGRARGDYDGRGNWGRVNAIAQQNGYRDGIRHGERDRQRRLGINFAHSSQYRNALSGYRFEYGNRDRYRDAYRQGYRRGYIEGFRRGDHNRSRWPF